MPGGPRRYALITGIMARGGAWRDSGRTYGGLAALSDEAAGGRRAQGLCLVSPRK